MKELSRRSVLKGTVAGLGGVAAQSSEIDAVFDAL